MEEVDRHRCSVVVNQVKYAPEEDRSRCGVLKLDLVERAFEIWGAFCEM